MKNPLSQEDSQEYFGFKADKRVLPGGSWDDLARFSRVSYRFGNGASARRDYQGFRLFRTVEKS